MRVIVNRIWKGHFGTGLVEHAEQLRRERRAADAIPSCSSTWRSRSSSNGLSIKKLHREIMLSAVYQLERAITAGGLREGLAAIVSTGAPTVAA